MISLNYRDSRPIYEQVRENFRRLILAGVLKTDDKMPSVRSLATQLSINPNTIQRAYNELEAEGYICSVPGKGSFVALTEDANASRITEYRDKLKREVTELLHLGVSREELTAWIRQTVEEYDRMEHTPVNSHIEAGGSEYAADTQTEGGKADD